MSYYILPKNNNTILVDPNNAVYVDDSFTPIISYSIYNYYNKIQENINSLCENIKDFSCNTFHDLIKIIHPYELIFTTVPGTQYTVSKLNSNTNIFYDFLEILLTFNLFDMYNCKNINILHISNECEDTIECNKMLRENINDNIYFSKKMDDELIKTFSERNIDFVFIDTIDNNLKNCMINLIQSVMIILKCNTQNSSAVIKINHTIYKPVIDIIYLLCSLFDKVYITKPNSNNIGTFEKYIVCKGFIYDETKRENYKINYYRLIVFIKKLENKTITSIISKNLPYYFINKLDDINIILGQQQLEALDQIISLLKNKNREDKIETIKKINIQKSIDWCEKFKIPYNKFIEKTNIFLPVTKEEFI
jgi:hypothetical protein